MLMKFGSYLDRAGKFSLILRGFGIYGFFNVFNCFQVLFDEYYLNNVLFSQGFTK